MVLVGHPMHHDRCAPGNHVMDVTDKLGPIRKIDFLFGFGILEDRNQRNLKRNFFPYR